MTNALRLDPDYAVLRMVLADIGAMERPFVQWLTETEAIDSGIFHRLHEAWIDRFGDRVVETSGSAITRHFAARTWCGSTSRFAPA